MNPQTEQATLADSIARQVLAKLQGIAPLDPNALWDTAMIGRYAGVQRDTAAKWVKLQGFPPAVVLPSGGRAYKGREVMTWMERR